MKNKDTKEEEKAEVSCDENCGALREPITLEDYKKALEHWEYHRLLSGCSHAC